MYSLFAKLAGIQLNAVRHPVTLTYTEAVHPLARLYAQRHVPEREVANALNSIVQAQAVPFAQRQTLAARAAELPTGYCRFEDKTGYVHVRTARGGMTAEMLAWLIPWLGEEDIRYKLLYPGFHSAAVRTGASADELSQLRCVTSIGAKPDGERAAPMSLLFRFQKPVDGVFEAAIEAGRVVAARAAMLFTEESFHVAVWLGEDVPPLARGFVTDKRLYDVARYCAHVSAQMAGVVSAAYAAERRKEIER